MTLIETRGLPDLIKGHPEPLAPLPKSPLVNNVEYLLRLTTKKLRLTNVYLSGAYLYAPDIALDEEALFVPKSQASAFLDFCQSVVSPR